MTDWKQPRVLQAHPMRSPCGSQAAIQLLPRLFPPQHVAVLHQLRGARRLKRAGHSVQSFSAEALDGAGACKIIVPIHPNNPTGVRFDPGRLLNLAEIERPRRRMSSAKHCWITPEKPHPLRTVSAD
jgi:hypothetical protein